MIISDFDFDHVLLFLRPEVMKIDVQTKVRIKERWKSHGVQIRDEWMLSWIKPWRYQKEGRTADSRSGLTLLLENRKISHQRLLHEQSWLVSFSSDLSLSANHPKFFTHFQKTSDRCFLSTVEHSDQYVAYELSHYRSNGTLFDYRRTNLEFPAKIVGYLGGHRCQRDVRGSLPGSLVLTETLGGYV